ncbi:MAG: hypothetical protein HY873_04800 [Chloroflexi bacterium]|nr:hypothetical protein [Chloroflexota bacterium]
MRMEGKLTNTEGEFIASGPCEVNLDKGEVTMWPSWEVHMLERQRGELALDLNDGSTMRISDRHLTFKLQGPTEQRISVYRLRILPSVPEHLAAGYEEPAAGEQEHAAPQEPVRPPLHVVSNEDRSR